MKIDYVNSLIADLRKYSCADCEGEGCFAYRDCDEIRDRLMREAENVLERFAKMIEGRTEPDRIRQNQTESDIHGAGNHPAGTARYQ